MSIFQKNASYKYVSVTINIIWAREMVILRSLPNLGERNGDSAFVTKNKCAKRFLGQVRIEECLIKRVQNSKCNEEMLKCFSLAIRTLDRLQRKEDEKLRTKEMKKDKNNINLINSNVYMMSVTCVLIASEAVKQVK